MIEKFLSMTWEPQGAAPADQAPAWARGSALGLSEEARAESAALAEALADSEAALARAREAEHNARIRAMHDAATGLPNRELFDDRLMQAISLANRCEWMLAVMYLDLDRFKNVNDSHGHAAGDHVLKEVARRLSRHCRTEDTVCRNGGDEFLYLLVNPQGSANIESVARRVLDDIVQPMYFDGHELVVRPSIGIAAYPNSGTTAAQLIGHADTAMYRAKKQEAGYLLAV